MWQLIVFIVATIASMYIPAPQEFKNAFQSGQNYFVARDYKNAIRMYDYILYTESKFVNEDSIKVGILNNEYIVSVRAAAAYMKGNAFKQMNYSDSAIHYFRMVSLRKDEPRLATLAQFQIYDIYYKLGRYDEAIDEAFKLFIKFPDNKKSEQALYDIGWAYRETGKLDSSSLIFQKLLVKYPNTEYYARALYQIAQNYFDLGDYNSALAHWLELIEKFQPEIFTKTDWEKIELKAEKERKLFEVTEGRDVETTDLELVAKAYIKIGDAYRKLKNYDLAITYYKKIITTFTLIPSLQEVAWIKIADYTLAEKGIEEAIHVYREAIDQNFANKKLQAKLQYKIAETYQNAKLFTKAAEEYDFYINSYESVAEAIDFSVDKAKLSVILNYYNSKDFIKTVSHCDSFINKYAYSDLVPSVFNIKASALNFAGDYQSARKTLETLILNFPKSDEVASAKVQLGFTLYKLGDYNSALKELDEALNNFKEKIDTSEAYYYKLITLADEKRYDEAIAIFDRINFYSPYYPGAVNKICKIYSARFEFDNGEKFLQHILEIAEQRKDSINIINDIYFNFADLYINKGDYKLALDYLSKILKDSTIYQKRETFALQVLYVRGIISYQVENFEAAIADLEQILNNETFKNVFYQNVDNAYEKLALSYAKIGNLDKGVSIFNDLINQTTSEIKKGKYYSTLSTVFFEGGKFKESIEFANKSLAISGIDTATIITNYINIANSYKELGDLKKSSELLSEVAAKFPAAPEIEDILFQLAALYYDNQEYDQAIKVFNRYLNQYPEGIHKKDAIMFKAYSQYEIGDWQGAYNSMKTFISLYPQDPKSPDMQYYAGECMFNLRKFEQAIREYQLVYRRYPKSELAAAAMYNEGWCYYELQKPESMIETFKILAQKFPNSEFAPHGLFTIGDYYYNIKDYQNASTYYSELKKKYPAYEKISEVDELLYDLSQINSYLEYEKAMKYFDDKNYEKAIEELMKVLKKYPDASVAVGCRVNIAASYEMLENKKEAIKWYDEVIRLYKDSKDENERAAYFFAKEHKEWLENQ